MEEVTPNVIPASIAPASKAPPPEKPAAIRNRAWVITSFWAMVLLLGLPVWLWTTSIHRAALPLEEMLAWADGKACKPTFPLQIAVEPGSLSESEAQHLIRTTQHALDDLNEFPAHHLRLTRVQQVTVPEAEPPALVVNLVQQEDASSIRTQLRPHSTLLDVFYGANHAPTTSSSSSPLASTIASTLQDLFLEEQASIAYLLTNVAQTSSSPSTSTLGQGPQLSVRDQARGLSRSLTPELASKLERRQTRSVKYAPTYHITISLFTPTAAPVSWEIEAASQQYLQPLLSSLSISNFTIDTQVQLFAEFAPSFPAPTYDESSRSYVLPQETLSGFINAAEWPLSPSIGPGLTLNFVLYVPSPKTTPLTVAGTAGSTSWLVPQWGGVYILNLPDATDAIAGMTSDQITHMTPEQIRTAMPQHLSTEQIRPAMLTFSRQLLALLGAPDSPANSLELQIRSMARVRAASLLLSASSTLGSMARLTMHLHQIPIPETVAGSVARTLADLGHACDALRAGRFGEALRYARTADEQAEKAFFEKSMVGQVYFPDEHKVAVYLPLLAPVSVPLVTSAIKVLKQMMELKTGGGAEK